jgi:hypothetical protein
LKIRIIKEVGRYNPKAYSVPGSFRGTVDVEGDDDRTRLATEDYKPESFPPITLKDLQNPSKDPDKKYTLEQIFKTFEQIKQNILAKNKKQIEDNLKLIQTLSGEELSFKTGGDAYTWYVQNRLDDTYSKFKQHLNKFMKSLDDEPHKFSFSVKKPPATANPLAATVPGKFIEEQTEPFQKEVKKKHRKMKIRLIGKGGNTYNVGGKMTKPSYKRAKSAPPMEESN